MIRPLPSNIGFQYRLVPVFTWQKTTTPEQDVTESTHTQAAQTSGAVNEQSKVVANPGAEPAPDMRLVFSGYRWRAVAHFESSPNRGYERFTETEPTESADRARAQAIERQQVQASQAEAAIERQSNIDRLIDKPAD